MEPGTLTVVLRDFLTTVDGELSLCKGDHFLVHSVVDKHWCYGQCVDRTGRFPLNYLHKVDVPRTEDEEIFVAIAAFAGEQEGDLAFRKGELIRGGQEIEPGWRLGYIDSRKGIFPSSHVWQLDSTLLQKASRNRGVRRRARVKANLRAQLDEELDLAEGETVTVTEILEDGWCRGVTEDGREGTFPEGFIAYVEEPCRNSADTSRAMENDGHPASARSAAKVYKDFGESASSHVPYDEEPAPNYYDLFPEFAEEPPPLPSPGATRDEPANDSVPNPLGVEPYAITLFPFNAQFPNELSFGAGEVVRLIKRVDSEWADGTIDNERGIFPVSYVNVIVDCPEVRESPEERPRGSDEAPSKEPGALLRGSSVRVDYTFDAQMDGDLSVAEGDIVVVVDMANDDWVNVRNREGEVGLCPRGYLNSNYEPSVESEATALDGFALIGPAKDSRDNDDKEEEKEEEEKRAKRLSEPHRPAPPAPAPGRVPLQRQNPSERAAAESEAGEEPANDAVAAARQKKADHRQNVISELVITEKEYVRDLRITYETFNLHNPNFLEARGVNVKTLFGNIVEVIEVAEDLLDRMLRAMKGCDEEFQTIGPCFIKTADRLQTVYGKYCGNHEAALELLKKYEDNREITAIFDKGIETLRRQVACFDMSSILIKPVQRILKYPLILYELIKCTEDGHPDKPEIEEASKAMTDVASSINEYKRRTDLASKYLSGQMSLMQRMARLNMHSVAKKSSRLSAKLSASLGLMNLTADPEFEELERQFKSVEKCAWQLVKDAEQCAAYLSGEARCGEVLATLLAQYHQGASNREVETMRTIRTVIWSQYVQELRLCLERRVSAPVSTLVSLLEGPAVLIMKRHDKLLDYDTAISRQDKNRDSKFVQDELSSARINYEALNQQLLEELPTLIDAATKILVNCIGAFANARKLLSGKITKRYLALSESATEIRPQDILESFLVRHNLLWNQITRFGFAAMSRGAEDEGASWCAQTEKQRIALRRKYPCDRLYVVTRDVAGATSLDMGAAKGTLVGAIKNQDPMGDSARWFVDNGVIRGFLPSCDLRALPSYRQSPDGAATPDLICMDSPEREISRSSSFASTSSAETLCCRNLEESVVKVDRHYGNVEACGGGGGGEAQHRYENQDYGFVYAEYDFEGGDGTLAVSRGQALKVIRPCDERGNAAWWLVEDRSGKKGYVPHNYVTPQPFV